MKIIISKTAVQSGYGSAVFKTVTFLSKTEREHLKNNTAIIAYKSERLSGGNHGTHWRIVKLNRRGRNYYDPSVPGDRLLQEILAIENA